MSEEATIARSGSETQKTPPWALYYPAWNERHDDATQFIDELGRLDRGRLAALRRNVGNTLGEARGVPWIHYLLRTRRKYEERYFLVATLFDLNRRKASEEDLGMTLEKIRAKSSDSFERRFKILLDAQFGLAIDGQYGATAGGGELAYRLAQMVRLSASKERGIDWAVLIADLCLWDWDGKPVQKKWARNFYAPKLSALMNEELDTTVSTDQGETDAN